MTTPYVCCARGMMYMYMVMYAAALHCFRIFNTLRLCLRALMWSALGRHRYWNSKYVCKLV